METKGHPTSGETAGAEELKPPHRLEARWPAAIVATPWETPFNSDFQRQGKLRKQDQKRGESAVNIIKDRLKIVKESARDSSSQAAKWPHQG